MVELPESDQTSRPASKQQQNGEMTGEPEDSQPLSQITFATTSLQQIGQLEDDLIRTRLLMAMEIAEATLKVSDGMEHEEPDETADRADQQQGSPSSSTNDRLTIASIIDTDSQQ